MVIKDDLRFLKILKAFLEEFALKDGDGALAGRWGRLCREIGEEIEQAEKGNDGVRG